MIRSSLMLINKTTTDGVRKWRWQFAIRRLRAAYDAARSSIDTDFYRIEEGFEAFHNEDKPDPENFDEVASHEAWEEHLIDRRVDAEEALATIKQGFALILYHSWERHSAEWVEWKGNYRHHHVSPLLVNAGYVVSQGVHTLNKVANCIKHDSDELWKQKDSQAMFDPIVAQFVAEDIKPDYARYLILTDADMDGFFDALSESGPPGKATLGL